jgi:hypothetical protein
MLANSRLPLLKAMSITTAESYHDPKIGMVAAIIATRLDKMMKKELDMKLDESLFWTDSTCVLKYIGNKSTRFQTFVINRD